jgi:hypothetical protein
MITAVRGDLMRKIAWMALVFASLHTLASAQVSRPYAPPERTAAGTEWYASRQPIFVLGNYYYPAGSTQFFDGNRMVPSAYFDGVPIYQDTSLEPYSIVFVPIGRGLMQPYERRREGELAGTTGSVAPSFPVQGYAEAPLPGPEDAIYDPTYDRALIPAPADLAEVPEPVATLGTIPPPSRTQAEAPPAWEHTRPWITRTARLPQYESAVWVEYEGSRWFASGKAVPYTAAGFTQVGEFKGFPVYRAASGDTDTIYLPGKQGMVTPYTKR